jgi:hypothetical protein
MRDSQTEQILEVSRELLSAREGTRYDRKRLYLHLSELAVNLGQPDFTQELVEAAKSDLKREALKVGNNSEVPEHWARVAVLLSDPDLLETVHQQLVEESHDFYPAIADFLSISRAADILNSDELRALVSKRFTSMPIEEFIVHGSDNLLEVAETVSYLDDPGAHAHAVRLVQHNMRFTQSGDFETLARIATILNDDDFTQRLIARAETLMQRNHVDPGHTFKIPASIAGGLKILLAGQETKAFGSGSPVPSLGSGPETIQGPSTGSDPSTGRTQGVQGL